MLPFTQFVSLNGTIERAPCVEPVEAPPMGSKAGLHSPERVPGLLRSHAGQEGSLACAPGSRGGGGVSHQESLGVGKGGLKKVGVAGREEVCYSGAMATTRVVIRMDEGMKGRLVAWARRERRSVSGQCVKVLEEALGGWEGEGVTEEVVGERGGLETTLG